MTSTAPAAAWATPSCTRPVGPTVLASLGPRGRWIPSLSVSDLNATAEQRDDGLLLSNVVPMHPAFQSERRSRGGAGRGRPRPHQPVCVAEIWAYIHKALLRKYAFSYQGVNVVAGPVFDHNHDGRHDSVEHGRLWVRFLSVGLREGPAGARL